MYNTLGWVGLTVLYGSIQRRQRGMQNIYVYSAVYVYKTAAQSRSVDDDDEDVDADDVCSQNAPACYVPEQNQQRHE